MPAVYPHIRPGHEAASITDQKHSRATVFFRRAEAAQHVLRRPVCPAVRILLEQLLDHGGDDVTWRDGVDADSVLAPFRREVARELEDAGFACVVGGTDQALFGVSLRAR